MRLRRLSFATLAVAGLASFVALAVGITLYISSAGSLRSTQALLAERAETQVDEVEHRLDMLMGPVEDQAAWVAGAFAKGRIALDDGVLFGVLAATPQVAALCILDPSGTTRFWQRGRHGEANEAWCARPGGIGPPANGESPLAPVWFPAQRAQLGGPAVLRHETPLLRDGRYSGLLVQIVPVSMLSPVLAGPHADGKSTPFVVVDGDRVLAHPALAERPNGTQMESLPRISEIGDPVLARLRTPDPTRPVGMRALSRASVAAVLIGGERHLFIYRDIHRYGPQPWSLGIHVSTSQGGQLAEISRVAYSVLAGLAILVLAVLAAVLAARRISRPIQALVSAARSVREGRLGEVPRLPGSVIAEFDDVSGSFNEMVDGLRERDLIRDTLGRFVSDEVARGLLSGGGRLEPVETEATVLVCDIEGFTPLTDTLGPAGVVGFLNAFFEVMVEITERHHGVITQFQGDALLAVFNVPVKDAAHASNALRAAIEMVAAADGKAFAGRHVRNRIGMCTGRVVAGAVGSSGRQTYTVHGNAVNIAARLEALNKAYGTRILLAAGTAERCPGFDLRKVAEEVIRGYTEPVAVFTPGAPPEEGGLIGREGVLQVAVHEIHERKAT